MKARKRKIFCPWCEETFYDMGNEQHRLCPLCERMVTHNDIIQAYEIEFAINELTGTVDVREPKWATDDYYF